MMLSNILNIASIKSDFPKVEQTQASGKNLLLNNSIVKIEVLEKLTNNFKILVDGKVFQANLPVNANLNETFLAKIISTSPLTISLNNLLNVQNLTPQLLNALISKLQLRLGSTSEKVLKEFILAKKPIEKNKLNKLIDFIENSETEISENDIAALVQLVSSNENYYDSLNEELITIISLSPKNISREIFETLITANKINITEEFRNYLNKILSINSNEIENFDALKLKEHFLSKNEIFYHLEELKTKNITGIEADILNHFEVLFAKLYIAKACKNISGSSYDFLIIKNENEFEFFEFQSENIQIENQSSYKIELTMMPENLGEISVSGFLSESNLQLNVNSSNQTISIIENEKNELIKNYKSKLNISARINLQNGNKNEIYTASSKGNINVSV